MSRRKGRLEENDIRIDTIANNSVSTAKLMDGSVTQAKLGPLNYQLSNSSSNFTTTSTSRVDVTNLTVTITTTGRPVMLSLISDGTNNTSFVAQGNTYWSSVTIYFMRNNVDIAGCFTSRTATGATTVVSPLLVMDHVDFPSAGTYTYKIQAINNGAGVTPSIALQYCKLLAYEL